MSYPSSLTRRTRSRNLEASVDGHARRQARKRAAILATATEVFLEEGYARTSMDKVHAKVGGSKRTLYNHFPSKQHLFEAIVGSVSGRVLAALRPELAKGDLQTALLEAGIGYLEALLSREGLALYRAMVSEAPHFPELARSFHEQGPGRASRRLAAFFRERIAEGMLELADPQLAADQFLGAVRGDIHLAAVLAARRPDRAEIERSVRHVVGLFLRGAVVSARDR